MAAGWIRSAPDTPPASDDQGEWVRSAPDSPAFPAAPTLDHAAPGNAIEDARNIFERGRDFIFGHEPSPGDTDTVHSPSLLGALNEGDKEVANAVSDWASRGPAVSTMAEAYPHVVGAQMRALGAGYQDLYGAHQVKSAEEDLAAIMTLPQVAARIPGKDEGAKIDQMAKDPLVQKVAAEKGLDPRVFAGRWSELSGLSPAQMQAAASNAADTLKKGQDNLVAAKGNRTQAQIDERLWTPSDFQGGRLDPWSLKGLAFNTATAIPQMAAVAGAAVAGTVVGGPGVGTAAGAATAIAAFAPTQRASVKTQVEGRSSALLEQADQIDRERPLLKGVNGESDALRQRAADLMASSDTLADTAGFYYGLSDLAGALPLSSVLARTPGAKALTDRLVGAALARTVPGRVATAMVANGAGGIVQASIQKGIETGILHESQSLSDALKDIAYTGVISALTALPIAGAHEASWAPARAQAAQDQAASETLNRFAGAGSRMGAQGKESIYPGYQWNEATKRYEPTGQAPEGAPRLQAAASEGATGSASDATKPPSGETNGAKAATEGPSDETPAGKAAAYQAKVQTLNEAAAAAEKRSDVTLQPEEEGWSVHVQGKPVASFETAAAARQAMADARKLVGTKPVQAAAANTPPIETPLPIGEKTTPEVPGEQRGTITPSVQPEKTDDQVKADSRQAAVDYIKQLRTNNAAATPASVGPGIVAGRAFQTGPPLVGKGNIRVDGMHQFPIKELWKESEPTPAPEKTTILGQEVDKPAVPTEAQAAAGNFSKPTVDWHGLPIKIENAVGSTRRFTYPDGRPGKRTMRAPYGYFVGRDGADGDKVDVYVGSSAPDKKVAYVIDQLDPTGKHFDEHKVVVGVKSAAEAKALYLAHYQKGWKGFGGISVVPHEKLSAWLKSGDLSEPYSKDSVPVQRTHVPPVVKPNQSTDTILQYLAKHPRGISAEEAQAQGIDKADFRLARALHGIRPAFRKGGMTFDEAAEALHGAGYPVQNEEGRYDPNVLLARLADELRGRPSYSVHNSAHVEAKAAELQEREEMRGALESLAPEIKKESPEAQDFATLAAQARHHDEDAVERLLESQRTDAEIRADLERIIAQGHRKEVPEQSAASGAAEGTRAAKRTPQPLHDLFGVVPEKPNAKLEEEIARRDAQRNSGQDSIETGRADDLFSQARKNVDIEDVVGKPSKESPASKESAKALEDVGQKIGGARKDKWAERGMNLADLASMSDAEAATLVKKQAVWKPDYEALSTEKTPEVAAATKVMYDKLAAVPRDNTPEGRADYVSTMQAIKGAMGKVRTLADFRGLSEALIQALREGETPKSIADRRYWSIQKGNRSSLHFGYNEDRAVRKLVEAGFPNIEPWARRISLRESGASTDQGADYLSKESAKLGHALAPAVFKAPYHVIRTKEGRILGYESTKERAIERARAIYEGMKAGTTEGLMPDRQHLDEVKRTGLAVRGGDADANDFMNHFGFRGVEFGNWAANDERQKLVNLAFDALHDLSNILDVPPKALSLNGTLGIALGARGGGKFAAHYEPGKMVINMTKINGAGSLAHEWGHAFDHYMGELGRADAYKGLARGATGWYEMPRTAQWQHLRTELGAAWKSLMQVMYQRDRTKADHIREMEQQQERNVALRERESARLAKAEAAEQKDERFIKAMKEWLAGAEGRIRTLDKRMAEAREAPEVPGSYGKVATDYAKQANALSGKGDYWKRPTEMFARAFESYIFDKMAAAGNRSDYLVHGVEPERYAEGYKGNPYPKEDRPAINAAIERLIGELDTRVEGDKTVLFSRGQKTDLNSVQEGKTQYGGIEEPPRGAANAAQMDMWEVAKAPGFTDKAQLRTDTRPLKVGQFRSAFANIDTWQKAAHVLAPLRKSPQEVMTALVLDAKQRPLAVIRHSIGQAAEASVEKWSLAGTIAQVPGAASVYFAHNHPSGVLQQSIPDNAVTATMTELLKGSGIESKGMIVLGAGRKFASYHQARESGDQEAQIEAGGRTRTMVPLLGRSMRIGRGNHQMLGRSINSPAMASDLIRRTGLPSGVLLLDNRHTVQAIVPMTSEEMTLLRTEDPSTGSAALLSLAARANTNSLIPFGERSGVQNLVNFATAAALHPLDAFTRDMAGNWETQAGKMGPSDNFKRQVEGTGKSMSVQAVQTHVEKILSNFRIRPADVVVVGSHADLLARTELAEVYIPDDTAGMFTPASNTLYLVADKMHGAQGVAATLAHEYIVHFGLRAAFGSMRTDAYQDLMGQVAKAIPSEMRERWAQAFPETPFQPERRSYRNVAAEEALAYYGERYLAGDSVGARMKRLLDRFFGMIRDWARKVLGLSPKFDDLFIRRTLADLEAFLKRGRGGTPPEGEGSAAFAQGKPPFYSSLARALDQAKRDRGTGAEWESTLRNMPGVKGEELQWSGLKEWLAGRGRVDKQEVANYLHDNMLEVGEHWHESNAADKVVEQIRALGYAVEADQMDDSPQLYPLTDEAQNPRDGFDNQIPPTPNLQAARDLLAKLQDGGDLAPPKYGDYVEPGGQNYRELLLTLPSLKGETFHSGHWGVKNVVAHTRADDRTGPNGERDLHLAEVQSDWHQGGRERGYRQDVPAQLRGRVRELTDRINRIAAHGLNEDDLKEYFTPGRIVSSYGGGKDQVVAFHPAHTRENVKTLNWTREMEHFGSGLITTRVTPEEAARLRSQIEAGTKRGTIVETVQNQYVPWSVDVREINPVTGVVGGIRNHSTSPTVEVMDALHRHLNEISPRQAVPDAPFKTSWPELVLKRMLRYAAENGYDTLSWDTGNANAARYGLSQAVDRLTVTRVPGSEERYAVIGRKDDRNVIGLPALTPEALRQQIGKELAEKAMASGREVFTGEDLNVGGHGMRAFYDSVLPNKVNALVKRWGAKVEPSDVTGPIVTKYVGPEKSFDDVVDMAIKELNKNTDVSEKYRALRDVQSMMWNGTPYRAAMAVRATPDFAEQMGGELQKIDERVPAHRVRITPSMRDSLMEGQPLFRRKRKDGTPIKSGPGLISKGYELARRAVAAIQGNEFSMSLRRIADPRGTSEAAQATALVIRESLGALAQASEEALQNLQKYNKTMELLSHEDRMNFIYEMEEGNKQPHRELQPAANALRSLLDDWRDKVQELGVGALENWIENYFPHVWKDVGGAQKLMGQIFGRRPLNGPASFLKQRTIPTTREGIEKGLLPISTNPLILVFAKVREMQRFVAGVTLVQRLKDEGLDKFFRAEHLIPADWAKIEDAVGRVLQWSEPEQGFVIRGYYAMPRDAARVINNHLGASALRNFLPAQLFRSLTNVVTPLQLSFSAFHLGFTTLDAVISKNALGIERLLHGEPIRAAAAFLEANSLIAGVGMNLRRGYKLMRAYQDPKSADPLARRVVEALIAAGGRVKMDNYYAAGQGKSPFRQIGFTTLAQEVKAALTLPSGKVEAMGKAIGGFPRQYATRLWRDLEDIWKTSSVPALQTPLEVAGRAVRASTAIIMEQVVPMQKLGVFADLASDHIRRNPGEDQVSFAHAMQKIWDSVDNRLGELVYDNLFWNRTFKETLHIMVRSVGWNFGTIREIGGAPVDLLKALDYMARGAPAEALLPGLQGAEERLKYEQAKSRVNRVADKLGHKIAYVAALVGTTMVAGAILQYLLTGKGPQETKDYFFPRTGRLTKFGTPERISLPSYIKDIYEYSMRPGETVINKANPIFGILHSIYVNRNFYGDAIYDSDASPWQKIADAAHYAAKEVLPFSAQGAKQLAGAPGLLPEAPFLGVTPAPAYVTSPEQVERYDHATDERAYLKALERRYRAALDAKDAGEQAKLRGEIREQKLKLRETQHDIRSDKVKAREASKKVTDLIDGKDKLSAVAALRAAGLPALAALWEAMPETPRERVAQHLRGYA